MIRLFAHIFNMSMAAGWVVLAILLLRLLLRKAPKWIFVMLWGAVALRLLVPAFAQSSASLVPSTQTISPQIMEQSVPQIHIGISTMNNAINPVIGQAQIAVSPEKSVNVVHVIAPILTGVWVVGCCGFLGYCAVSYLRIRKRVATAVPLEGNVYESEGVTAAFLLGLWKPKIYLPFGLNPQERQHIIAHERAHIGRKDHLWKPFGFLLLTVYWFHPLMWLAYWLLCRDIELACDEKVAHSLDASQRADYSQTLLNHTVKRSMISACPLAFGQGSVKRRVKSVLNYKKPTFWILLVAIVAVAVLAVCFLTDPLSDPPTESGDPSKPIEPEVSIEVYSSSSGGVTFDIDGDGVDEVCSISHELALSAYFPYSISVTDNGELEYYNSFALTSRDVYFRDTNQGMLFCVDSDDVYWDYYYKISIVNDVIVLTPYDENTPIIYYTGDQGVNKDMRVVMDEAGNVTGMEPLPVISNQIIPAVNMQSLERQYPQYFDLPTGNGLSVYIWQMSSQSYYCALVAGKDTVYTQQMLWDLHKSALTIDQARAIVNTYELDQSMVSIKPIQMWHSSYAYTIDEEYTKQLEELFWNGTPMTIPAYKGYIDYASFDIDGDGEIEHCTIGYGHTSGRFTFKLHVLDGDREYSDTFGCEAGELSFIENEKGVFLQLSPSVENALPVLYSVSAKDGQIKLTHFAFGDDTGMSLLWDAAEFDIDQDGKTEHCILSHGYTSGLFTFYLTVLEDGVCEYQNGYNGDAGELSFMETDKGWRIKQEVYNSSQIIYYDISIRDGNVVLSHNGEEVEFYGLQGADWAQKLFLKMNEDGEIFYAESHPVFIP